MVATLSALAAAMFLLFDCPNAGTAWLVAAAVSIAFSLIGNTSKRIARTRKHNGR